MDIGGVNDKGKGGKGKKGKTKTEKGDPAKGSWNQQSWTPTWKGSSQQQGNPKGGSSNKGEKGKQASAGKQCHICKKYGHIAAECHWKVSEVREEPESSPSADKVSIGSVRERGSDTHTHVHHTNEHNMIMTVRDSISVVRPYHSDEFVWFMVDSGACVTCATVGELDVPVDTTKTRQLYSVQGAELKVYGEQTPAVELSDGLRGTMRVTVIDASENVLAVNELLDKSWKSVVFSKYGGSFLEHTNGKQYPLTKFGKRWWIQVKKCALKTLKGQEANNRIAANSDSTTMHSDEWRREHPLLIRVHRVPRRNLFTSLGCADCPVDVSNLETGRLTRMVFCGGRGEDCLEDVWVGDHAHRRLAQHFVGGTCFRLKDDASMFDTPSDPDAEVGHMHAEDSWLAEGEAQAPKVNVVPLPHEPTETERAEHNLQQTKGLRSNGWRKWFKQELAVIQCICDKAPAIRPSPSLQVRRRTNKLQEGCELGRASCANNTELKFPVFIVCLPGLLGMLRGQSLGCT